MGLLGFFKRKGSKGEAPPPADEAPEPDDDDDGDGEVSAVALVREGMSLPSDDEMQALLRDQAPDCVDLPRHGLAQPHWWKQEDWVGGGLRGVARALAGRQGNDPDKATWRVVKDEHGARVGIVFLRK